MFSSYIQRGCKELSGFNGVIAIVSVYARNINRSVLFKSIVDHWQIIIQNLSVRSRMEIDFINMLSDK